MTIFAIFACVTATSISFLFFTVLSQDSNYSLSRGQNEQLYFDAPFHDNQARGRNQSSIPKCTKSASSNDEETELDGIAWLMVSEARVRVQMITHITHNSNNQLLISLFQTVELHLRSILFES